MSTQEHEKVKTEERPDPVLRHHFVVATKVQEITPPRQGPLSARDA